MARAGGNLGVWGSLVLLVSSFVLRTELGAKGGRHRKGLESTFLEMWRKGPQPGP